MKKIAFSGAAIALAAILAAPVIISDQLQQDTEKFIAEVNELSMYKAELISTEQTWLSSDIKLKVGFDLADVFEDESMTEQFQLLLSLHVDHGPLLASGLNLAEFDLQLENSPMFASLQWDQSQALYQLTGEYNLLGDLSYRDRAPEISYVSDDNDVHFHLSPYQGKAETIDGELLHKGVLPELTLTSSMLDIALEQVAMKTHLKQSISSYFNLDELPLYDASVEVADTHIEAKLDGTEIDIKKLAMLMSSELDREKHLARGELVYKLEQLVTDAFEIKDLALVLETNNIDEQSYLNINQFFATQPMTADPDQQFEETLAFLKANLLALLKPEPEFNITMLKGEFNEGHFEAVLNTKLTQVAELPQDLLIPEFWLRHLKADSRIQVAKPLALKIAKLVMRRELTNNGQLAGKSADEVEQLLAQQVPAIFAMLEQQGKVLSQGHDYVVTFEMADKTAKLNGVALPITL